MKAHIVHYRPIGLFNEENEYYEKKNSCSATCREKIPGIGVLTPPLPLQPIIVNLIIHIAYRYYNLFFLYFSHAINSYLVTKYAKDDSLYPIDPFKRAQVDQRLHFDSGVLFARFRFIIVRMH
jgi:hypothetical protein